MIRFPYMEFHTFLIIIRMQIQSIPKMVPTPPIMSKANYQLIYDNIEGKPASVCTCSQLYSTSN